VKAVLEFNYPEDEIRLRRALNGDKFADALWDVKNKVREHFKYEADPAEVLKVVRELVDATLLEAGEDV
jgi:hypothetical protein